MACAVYGVRYILTCNMCLVAMRVASVGATRCAPVLWRSASRPRARRVVLWRSASRPRARRVVLWCSASRPWARRVVPRCSGAARRVRGRDALCSGALAQRVASVGATRCALARPLPPRAFPSMASSRLQDKVARHVWHEQAHGALVAVMPRRVLKKPGAQLKSRCAKVEHAQPHHNELTCPALG